MRRVLLAAACLAGCDSLATKDYVGEPLFRIAGTLATTAPADPVTGIALMWQDARGAGGPGVAATAVPVALELPATFRADVPVPPPEEARFDLDGTGVALAEAYVYVVGEAPELETRGLDRTHALVYASGDVVAGTLAADYLGGPVSAGYHLREITLGPPGTAQGKLVAACIANGASREACTARRNYQLAGAADDEPMRIVVLPP